MLAGFELNASGNRRGLHAVHGEARRGGRMTPEYRAWQSMRHRCYAPGCRKFPAYGGRGIRVCADWRDSYAAFLRDVGRRPSPRHSLDRIDTNGHYEPGNVRWATVQQQNRNRRTVVLLTASGRTQCLAAWSAETGIGESTIRFRLRSGWSPERALTEPVRGWRRVG